MKATVTRSTPGRLVAVLLGLLVLGATVGALPGRAQAPLGFSTANSAYGMKVELSLSAAPLFPDLVDAGGPFAQVAMDTIGNSQALAAFPYPGDTMLNLPGLVAGLGPQAPGLVNTLPGTVAGSIPNLPPEVGGALSDLQVPAELFEPLVPLLEGAPRIPDYPLAAKADSLTPAAEQDLGFGHLRAQVAPEQVQAEALVDPGAGGVAVFPTRALAEVTSDVGGVVSEAVSDVSGVQLGPVRIGSVRSLARMTLSPDGDVVQESEFRVTGLEIAGIAVDLTPDGFEVAGEQVPAPVAETLNQVLADADLEVSILPEERTDSAVIASGLQITRALDVDTLGTGQLRFVFGRSSVQLSGAEPVALPPVPDPPEPPDTSASQAQTDQPAEPVEREGVPDSATQVDLPASRSIDTNAVAAPADTPSVASPSPPSQTVTPVAATSPRVEPGFDATGLYLLVVAAALVAFLSGQLLRAFAFRPDHAAEEAS